MKCDKQCYALGLALNGGGGGGFFGVKTTRSTGECEVKRTDLNVKDGREKQVTLY